MPFTTDYKPKTRDSLLLKELDDGAVLYEPATETFHTLNHTAAYIYCLCDGRHPISDIVAAVQSDFSTFTTDPQTEVPAIINQFAALGLLEPIQ